METPKRPDARERIDALEKRWQHQDAETRRTITDRHTARRLYHEETHVTDKTRRPNHA